VRWLLETRHKATHSDDKAKLRWLDPYLGAKYLDEIDRTLIDRIKFDREKIGSGGTTNRYLALVRSILRRACNEWEWIDRVPKFKLFREAEGRVRSLTRRSSTPCDASCPSISLTWRCSRWPQDCDRATSRVWSGSSWTSSGGTHGFRAASTRTARLTRFPPLNEMACAALRKQIGKHPTRVFTFRGEPIVQVGHQGVDGGTEAGGNRRLALA